MNEPNFYMFFLYNFDLHNLSNEKMLRSVANPFSEFRWSKINFQSIEPSLYLRIKDSTYVKSSEITEETHSFENDESEVVEDLVTKLKKVEIEKKEFQCTLCSNKYKAPGYLKAHMETKHQQPKMEDNKCIHCGKSFSSEQACQKHMEKCHLKSCKYCSFQCNTDEDMKEHKKIHTTCEICGKDLLFPSKLTRHMTYHK